MRMPFGFEPTGLNRLPSSRMLYRETRIQVPMSGGVSDWWWARALLAMPVTIITAISAPRVRRRSVIFCSFLETRQDVEYLAILYLPSTEKASNTFPGIDRKSVV